MIKSISISFYLTNHENMKKVNKRVFGKTATTDVISIPLNESYETKEMVGEIIVNQDQVKVNAKKFKVTYKAELARVVAHGVLHLLGDNDDNEESRQAMRTIEDSIIKEF